MSKLYVFGDSHAVPAKYCPMEDSFWGLAAKDLSVNSIENYAHNGCSNETIEHVILGLLLEKKITQADYMLIGISVLERFTTHVPHDEPLDAIAHNARRADRFYTFDKDLNQTGIHDASNMCRIYNVHLKASSSEAMILNYNRMWDEARLYRRIFLLSKYLDQLGLKYIVVNLASKFHLNTEEFGLGLPRMLAPPKFLITNGMYDVNVGLHKPVDYDDFEYWGHHGSEGNRHFYKVSLKPAMQQAEWL